MPPPGTALGSARSVRAAWDEMNLSHAPADQATSLVQDDVLSCVVSIVSRALHPAPGGERRPTPSAGAIFPFTVLVLAAAVDPATGSRGWQYFRMADAGAARLIRLPGTAQAAADAARLLADVDGRAAHVFLLVRPWLSMRRYGTRGYLYAHLDAGHAATSLVGGVAPDHDPALRLPPHSLREVLAPVLPPFHEVHSVLSLTPDTAGRAEPVTIADAAAAKPPDPLEALCWEHYVAALRHGGLQRWSAARPVPVLGGARHEPADGVRARWHRLTAARRSCRTFHAAALPAAAWQQTLSALGTPLPLDLGRPGRDAAVRATLVVNPAAALAPETREAVARFAGVTDRPPQIWPDDLVAACRGQAPVAHAHAYLLLHADAQALFGDDQPQRLHECLFRAAAAAHLVQLAAAGTGVGVFAVGRFDQGVWRQAAGLADTDHLIYLLALGNTEDTP